MIGKLQKIYAFNETGTRDLVRTACWTVAVNLSLMVPVGLLASVLNLIATALLRNTDASAGVGMYTVLAVFLVAVMCGIHRQQYKALYIATYRESANRRIQLGEKLWELPLLFFGKKDLSNLTSTLVGDCSSLEQTFFHYIPQCYGMVTSTVLTGIGLLYMDWGMGIVALQAVPVSALLVYGSKWPQDGLGTYNLLEKRAAADGLQELLEAVKDIKACNQKERYLEGINEELDVAERATVHSELATGICITFVQAFLKAGPAIMMLAGIMRPIDGSLDLSLFSVYLIAAPRFHDPVSAAFTNTVAMFSAKIKVNRMREMEEQPVQTRRNGCEPSGYDIGFEHVRFAYHEQEGVFKDVTFDAKQEEVTVLVGPSGGGKSTAAELVARFWDANSGRVTLGGVDVSSMESETLLKHFVIVFQDVVLFYDMVLKNIRLGRRDATGEEVMEVVRAAQCEEFVNRLPEGHDTVIGENGSALSGGERQRIFVARALLRDASVTLPDGATASLNVENEAAVQKVLSGLAREKTMLIIAHRVRTVMGADKVVVLADGWVVEVGRPKALIRQKGSFWNMVEIQMKDQQWVLEN